MENLNSEEYKLVRDEMTSLKDCITNYMGFVIGGSGAAILGLAAIAKISENSFALAYTSMTLSLIITFILLIMFYKFYSYNRYAGYCKLLNIEKHGKESDVKVFSWEVCVDKLRYHDRTEGAFNRLLEKAEFKDLKNYKKLPALFEMYSGPKPTKDNCKIFKGFKEIFLSIFGRAKTSSWNFPPYVVMIFSLLCVVFWGLGIYTVGFKTSAFPDEDMVLAIFAYGISVLQLFLWFHFIGKLYIIMNGSATVDAFFWKFLPIRNNYLKVHSQEPEYLDLDVLIKEALN